MSELHAAVESEACMRADQIGLAEQGAFLTDAAAMEQQIAPRHSYTTVLSRHSMHLLRQGPGDPGPHIRLAVEADLGGLPLSPTLGNVVLQ